MERRSRLRDGRHQPWPRYQESLRASLSAYAAAQPCWGRPWIGRIYIKETRLSRDKTSSAADEGNDERLPGSGLGLVRRQAAFRTGHKVCLSLSSCRARGSGEERSGVTANARGLRC